MARGRTYLSAIMGLGAASVVVPLLVASPANAISSEASPERPVKRTQTRIAGADLRRVGKPGTQARGQEKADVESYLRERASQGSVIDLASVNYAEVADPSVGRFSIVWDGGEILNDVYVNDDDYGNSKAQTVGFSGAADPQASSGSGTTTTGAGFEFGYNAKGMTRLNDRAYCTTLYWTPAYRTASTGARHTVSSCYEKWRTGSTERFIYNRWALLNRAVPASGIRAEIVDFTIRTRPWSGYGSYVRYLDGWTPSQGSSTCTEIAAVKLPAGPGELTIPMHKCSVNTILVDVPTKMVGNDFNGRTPNQLSLDFGMSLGANSSPTGGIYVPYMSDYTWFTVASCGDVGLPCYVNNNDYVNKPGW